MTTQLAVMLLAGLVLNLCLGYLVSWYLVNNLVQSDRFPVLALRSGAGKAATIIVLGTLVAALTFVLTIMVIWPPHIWQVY